MAKDFYKVEIANLVCTFHEKPLLDEFERFYKSISKPLFVEWRRSETLGYKFIDVTLVSINNDVYVIGRLVKKMLHIATQNLDENDKLKKVSKSMKDDPSSIFVLRLFDHKLIIVEETKKAPKVKDFEKALKKVLKINDKAHFKSEIEKYRKHLKRKRLTPVEKSVFTQSYNEVYPPFYLTITAIASSKDVDSIFQSAKEINIYRLKIPHSNDENPIVRNSFMNHLSKTRVMAGSDKTTSGEFSLKDTEVGLDKSFVKEITKDVANSGGTFSFHMTGKTINDEKLNISEENIKVTYSIEKSSDILLVATRAADKFVTLVADGSVLLAKMADESKMIKKALLLFGKLRNDK